MYMTIKTTCMVFMPHSRQEGMVKGRKELLLLHMEGCINLSFEFFLETIVHMLNYEQNDYELP